MPFHQVFMVNILISLFVLFSFNLYGHDKFILYAIPKCGTNYIQHIFSLLTGKESFNANVSGQVLQESEQTNRILRIHQPYSRDIVKYLKKMNYKVVVIYRDPRDALISHLFYMRGYNGSGQLRDFFWVTSNFDQLTFDSQLTALMTGIGDMSSYLSFYSARIPWVLDSDCYAVKYEDLLGEDGGGNCEVQKKTIKAMASYLGIKLSPEKLENVVQNMYRKGADVQQGNHVFSRASSGNWRTFFKPGHKQLFKQVFGKKLIILNYEKDMNW